MLKTLILGLLASFILWSEIFAQSDQKITLKKQVSGLGIPWGMTFIDEKTALISEKNGSLKKLDFSGESVRVSDIYGIPEVMAVGQGGLLDIKYYPSKIHGNENHVVFFTFVANSSLSGKSNLPTLKLAKALLRGDQLQQVEVLFEANHPQSGGRHFGSRIAFDDEGHVFFSMGDRGQRGNSQDLSKHSGSILRLNIDGSVPKDNPFVDQEEAMPEIWSYGHRNPQGLAFDFVKKQLWSNEHGPRGGDEINIIVKGKNYGWPVISYGREYISNRKVGESTKKQGLEQPVTQFTPSIAPSSLLFYSGKKKIEWQGVIMSGALKLRHLNLVFVDQNDEFLNELRLFESEDERIRNVVESPEGKVYIATDQGNIYQLQF